VRGKATAGSVFFAVVCSGHRERHRHRDEAVDEKRKQT